MYTVSNLALPSDFSACRTVEFDPPRPEAEARAMLPQLGFGRVPVVASHQIVKGVKTA